MLRTDRHLDAMSKGNEDMWWIIGIMGLIILLFLWMIVRSAARSVDEDTQAMYDKEQSDYIAEYYKEKEFRSSSLSRNRVKTGTTEKTIKEDKSN